MSSKLQLNLNTKYYFTANIRCKNEVKLIPLPLRSPLMTDDFIALVYKTGKGKPKFLGVFLCRKSNQYYYGLRGEKRYNNRLRTDTQWLCGSTESFKTDIS